MSTFLFAFGIMIPLALRGVVFCDSDFLRAFVQRKDIIGVRKVGVRHAWAPVETAASSRWRHPLRITVKFKPSVNK